MIIENLSPKSTYAYLLLKKDYVQNDINIINNKKLINDIKDGIMSTTGIRKIFFRKIKRKLGTLKCQVCGKVDLIEDAKDNQSNPNLATIEHLTPRSKGGLRYDESNFICTCYKCNNKRGDLPIFYIGNDMWIF